MRLTSFTFLPPARLTTSMPALALPPVASIGSTIMISLSEISEGSLQ